MLKEDPEVNRNRALAWGRANKERAVAKAREWRLANPEKHKEKCREYYQRKKALGLTTNDSLGIYRAKPLRNQGVESHLALKIAKEQKVRLTPTEQRAKNYKQSPHIYKAIAARWRKNHPDAVRAASHIRRARKRAATGKHTERDIKDIHRMQKGKCAYCRASLRKGYQIDHIIPLSKGGSNDRSNIRLTCAPCNGRKGDKDPVAFVQSLGFLV